MNYVLKGASSTFQRYINTVLWNLISNDNQVTFFAYKDDILVASNTEEDHVLDLRAIFTRLADNNFKSNELKCSFGVSDLDVLGHRVSKDGLLPLPEKVEAISSFKQPLKVNGLRRFIGLLNYYRRHIAHSAGHLTPLFNLRINTPHLKRTKLWSGQMIRLKHIITPKKYILTNVSLLAYPNPQAQFSLTVPYCNKAWCRIATKSGGSCGQIVLFSSKLSPTQAKYSTLS